MLSTSMNPLLYDVTFFPGASVVGTYQLLVPAAYMPNILGAQIIAQYLVLDGLYLGGDVITGSSHALLHTVGLQ
jgi:hypothetical protein